MTRENLGQSGDRTYWNGEPCEARAVRVIVADDPRFTLYWAREFIGQEREAVEVNYAGHVFYLDNENGSGWRKVTEGRGSPQYGHSNLAVEHVL